MIKLIKIVDSICSLKEQPDKIYIIDENDNTVHELISILITILNDGVDPSV
jgi:AAA15 family ATPase/GTPase